MCRLAAYIGSEPLALSALLYDPPHSLQHAAYKPRELLLGTVNVDGTGAAWWPEGATTPLRYVTTHTPWADPNLPGLAPSLLGSPVLAAVRSATPDLPFGTDNVSPFVVGRLAISHNGWIGDFRKGVGRTLLGRLSDVRFSQLSAMNDSLALSLLVAQQLDNAPDQDLSDAVVSVITDVAKVVYAARKEATLNLVVASADSIVAVRTSVNFAINSLYTRRTTAGSWLASEPLNDDIWEPVPDHSLVVMTADVIDITALEHEGMA